MKTKPITPARSLVVAAGTLLGISISGADTIAYWRFEGDEETAPTDGAYVQNTAGFTAIQEAGIPVPDVSGNGNNLYTWDVGASGHLHRPTSAGEPFLTVPQTGAANDWYIENSGDFPATFTWSSQAPPSGTNIDTWTSPTWTIEASLRTDILGGFRTVVGRDGNDVVTANGSNAPVYFQKTDGDQFRILYADADGFSHEAIDPDVMETGTWYHFAATSDGEFLRLYKKTGNTPYEMVAETDLTATDSTNTALADPGTDANGDPWSWSVGRGRYGASDLPTDNHVDRWFGGIDEVRISDVALDPSDLLGSISDVDEDGDNLPDAWETAHFGSITAHDADDDPDGDGADNLAEFNAGSDPNDIDSVPGDIDGDGLADTWEQEFFGSLGTQDGTGDADGDLATNEEEETAGSDPTNFNSWPDADSDGMNDAFEVAFFGDTETSDGTADTDSDGFTDLEEAQANTDPTDSDFSPAFGQLRHRWSFNGDLTDSVGGSDAQILPGGSTNPAVSGSEVVQLTGGAKASSDYVLLGNNLLQGTSTPVTIELWATQNGTRNWARIFDFHGSTEEELHMTWTRMENTTQDIVEWKSDVTVNAEDTNAPYSLLTQYHIVMRVEPGAGANGTTRVTWYSADAGAEDLGFFNGSFDTPANLVNLNDAINALGFSPFEDDVASASYDEVRIWNGGLRDWALEALHDQGTEDASLPDTDGDGLPDAWENFYGTDPESTAGDDGATGDPDGDEADNRAELLAGSDPFDATSNPADTDADGLPDEWEIANFGDLSPGENDDPDGDFAFNSEEFEAGTDPNDGAVWPDSDNDDISDGWELAFFNNLTSTDGGTDEDSDGFTELEEFEARTDPFDPLDPGAPDGDGDGDGLDDSWEVIHFGDLLSQDGAGDPDGDGTDNLAEYRASSDPNSDTSTPTDIDGDGTDDQFAFFDFESAGDGLTDQDGEGLPFTERLAGTGTALAADDPNLDLDTAAGIMALTTTTADVNGQVGMDVFEAIGIPLSSLGFTGNQDFRVRAKYINLPDTSGTTNQVGAFVGDSSTAVIRGGRIFGGTALGVNTNGQDDSDASFIEGLAPATRLSMTVTIERIDGVWSVTVNEGDASPGAQPAFLDAFADLTVGVFGLDLGADEPSTFELENFTAVSFGADTPAGDADGDGLADEWETENFGSIEAQDGDGDPDGDGRTNLFEFAFNGDPNNGGDQGEFITTLEDSDTSGADDLVYTLSVRAGATFAAGPNGSQTAQIEGLTYTVRGSLDLAAFESAVTWLGSEASDDPDWELHSFRLDASEGLPGAGFMNAEVVETAP